MLEETLSIMCIAIILYGSLFFESQACRIKKLNGFLELGCWKVIQVDTGGHPLILMSYNSYLASCQIYIVFWVSNFQGHFEALNEVFLSILN